jgi:hypothetical protein
MDVHGFARIALVRKEVKAVAVPVGYSGHCCLLASCGRGDDDRDWARSRCTGGCCGMYRSTARTSGRRWSARAWRGNMGAEDGLGADLVIQ